MRVHYVHIRHGQAKAGLLGFGLTKLLEQWDIIKEHPNFRKISGHVQCSMVYHLQQPQLFTVWVALWRRSAEIDFLTHRPSDGALKDESNYETEGEKRTSYNESCGCFDICKPAHVRASRVGMIKSRHMVKNAGETCTLTVLIVLLCQSQIWNCFRASISGVQQSSFGRHCLKLASRIIIPKNIALKPIVWRIQKGEAVEAPRWMVTTSRCTAKMALTKLLTYHAFRVQSRKKSWVQGWLAPSGTWALTHQSAWRKTSGLAWKYEICILNDILQGMRHAARQLVTAGVRMLPCFPGVGDGADYGTFGPQTNGVSESFLGVSFSQEMIQHLFANSST